MTGPLRDVLAAIERVKADLPVSELRAARDELEDLTRGLTELTTGTSRSEPGEIIALIGEACEQIDTALGKCDATDAKLTTYVASIQSGSGTAAPAPASDAGSVDRPTAPQPYIRRPLPAPQASDREFDPTAYLKDMPTFVAKRGHRTKTHGRWAVDQDTTMDLISGRDEYADRADRRWQQVKRPSEPAPINAAADVELKFATYMNDHGIDKATIVINNPKGPCAGIVGCDEQLSRFLDTGRKLTVCWPGGTKTYTGSGEKRP